jgi:Transposase DDE domain
MENHSKSPSKYSYKITNWKEYNNSLRKRGKVSVWISSKLLSIWKELDVIKISVGEQIYPDVIIEFCLIIKNIYHLPFRQTTGFIEDLLALQGLENYCVPDSSTLCRRAKHLPVNYFSKFKDKKDLHILVDSTGLKVYGQGEWMVKKHGASKHRTWLKLHLALDANTQEIITNLLTNNSIDDANAAKEMLKEHQDCLLSLAGDGAYDKFFFREFLGNEIVQKIPPPCNAVVKIGTEKVPVPAYLLQRNQAVERIKEVGSKEWKKEVGYHRRSLAETAMFRYKIIFGDKASARIIENQITEVNIKCKILNKFTNIGMSKTIRILKN